MTKQYSDTASLAYFWQKIKAYIAKYIIPVSQGGTGATTAAAARANLGLGALATENNIISEETVQAFEAEGIPIE